MRRAVHLLLALPLLIPVAALADEVQRPEDIIDGAGMINYMQRPSFTVGSWVKYHVTGKSERGMSDDYTITILVGGEEMWWGEPCFWVETRTQKSGGGRERVTASLISYSAFGDTLADTRLLWFMRKTINGMKSDGRPDVALYTRGKSEVQLRREAWEKDDTRPKMDSLGTETVQVPAGTFETYKVRHRYGHAETAEQGDSTVYYERRLERVFFRTPQVPCTQLAKIEVDDLQQGKTWMAGKFDKGALHVLERARGKTELIAYGTSGMKAALIPVESRRSLDRKVVDAVYDEWNGPAASNTKRRAGGR